MAERSDDVATDPEAKGKTAGRKKTLLLTGGLLLLIAASVALTTFIFSTMQPETATVAEEPVPAGSKLAMAADPNAVTALREQIDRQAQAITRLEAEVATLQRNSGERQLNRVLASQELSFQLFLLTLKEGMGDMANMVRGSRTWLEHYQGRLDEVISQSRGRAESLAEKPAQAAAPVMVEP